MMDAIIRPFVFTKAAMYDRAYHWVAELLGLFAAVIYLVTLGYYDPCWQFDWLNFIKKRGPQPDYDNIPPMKPIDLGDSNG